MEKTTISEESKKGIGQTLREEREKIGLTYEQICEITKLRPGILEAIEKEAWEKLPPSVFVKGFIRSYAQTLHLDPDMLIEMYNTTEHAQQNHVITKEETKGTAKKSSFIWILLIVLILVLMLLAAIGVKKYYMPKRHLKTPSLKDLSKAYTAVSIEEPVYNFPIILKARTRKRTWLKIALDRQEEEKYLVQPGEYISWQVKNRLELIAGDAGGIELWLNNMPVYFNKKNGRMLYLRLYPKKHKGVNRI